MKGCTHPVTMFFVSLLTPLTGGQDEVDGCGRWRRFRWQRDGHDRTAGTSGGAGRGATRAGRGPAPCPAAIPRRFEPPRPHPPIANTAGLHPPADLNLSSACPPFPSPCQGAPSGCCRRCVSRR
ncbi:hypothetical protein M432DRAFT_8938 [Thermoascus aurantiacus ATCC 26904]